MSLETELAANTAAMVALTAALCNLPQPGPAEPPHEAPLVDPIQPRWNPAAPAEAAPRVSPPTAGENDVITDVKVKAPKAPKPAAVSPPPETAAASPASTPKAITYEAVKAALIAVSQSAGGRQLALDALSRLGVANAKDLDPGRYADALELFAAALENQSV